MASFELPEIPQAPMTPQMLVGVASPLWGYFAAAAAGGVAYWWMTRWTRPVNLEAFFQAATKMTPLPMAAAAEEMAEAVAEAAVEAAESVLDKAPVPVGGEAAPISPVAVAEPAKPVTPEPAREAPAADPAMAREDKPSGAVKEAVEAATGDSSAEAPDDKAKPQGKKAPTGKSDA